MMIRSMNFGLLFWVFGWSIVCGMQTETDSTSVDWLTGSGETLEFRVKGVAVDESGNRINDVDIICEKQSMLGNEKQKVQMSDDGGFLINIPGNENLWSINVTGVSADGSHFGRQNINGREFRRIAREGLTMTLFNRDDNSRFRKVTVSVVDENGPVPGASVKAVAEWGMEVTGVANDLGVAVLALPVNEKLRQLTAWQKEQRVGGFQFDRTPVRDPNLDAYTVELNRSRPTTVRMIDEQGEPVPNVRFELDVATGAPDFNFIGQPENSAMTTDQLGEAVVNWFPDLANGQYWINVKTGEWLKRDLLPQPINNNQINIVLRKSKDGERQKAQGRVEFPGGAPAGFQVSARSFQGEVENLSDVAIAFTDQDGNFFIDILPGSKYCYFIDDSEWLSEIQDAILYDPEIDEQVKPVLVAIKGQKVEVIATQGSDKQPMPNTPISLSSVHRYTWMENGEQQSGSSGRSWSVTTNADGRATTFAAPGPLEASIYTTDWRTAETVEVTTDKTTEVKMHRPIANAIRLIGRLTGGDGTMLQGANVHVAALDGHTRGQQIVLSDAQGKFECDVKSVKVGIHTYTEDGRFSATRIVDLPTTGAIDLELEPTVEYSGQILGEEDQPIANAWVRARVELDLGLVGNTIETTTDEQGRYVLTGIPIGVRFVLEWQPADKSSTPTRIGERFATTGEKRPLDIVRAVRKTAVQPSFAEYMNRRLGDCLSYGINSLVVVVHDEQSKEWANEVIKATDENCAIVGYLPTILDTSKLEDEQDRKAFMAEYDLTVPESGRATLCAINGKGDLLSRLDLDCADADSMTAARDFIETNEPTAADALYKLNAALDEAKSSGRVVWAQHSQTRCAPCYALSRWVEKHRAVLEKQFVFVKVDDVREENGIEVSKRVTRDRPFGIPFVAIMNADGEVLIDGDGPLGNIGYPSSFESCNHLRKMISTTGDQITDSELDALIKSLQDQ